MGLPSKHWILMKAKPKKKRLPLKKTALLFSKRWRMSRIH